MRRTNHLTSLSFCQSDWKIGLKELGATVKVNSASGLNFPGSIYIFFFLNGHGSAQHK